ncbi:hypothetical protein [Pseudomonas sp.]|uniref:hypothetical protein n=1 Tax=Pseudomonas sp. TaxID=306 RepID=UPI0025829494|nr:hypothetical protein [Pseudomonas sp.]
MARLQALRVDPPIVLHELGEQRAQAVGAMTQIILGMLGGQSGEFEPAVDEAVVCLCGGGPPQALDPLERQFRVYREQAPQIGEDGLLQRQVGTAGQGAIRKSRS